MYVSIFVLWHIPHFYPPVEHMCVRASPRTPTRVCVRFPLLYRKYRLKVERIKENGTLDKSKEFLRIRNTK